MVGGWFESCAYVLVLCSVSGYLVCFLCLVASGGHARKVWDRFCFYGVFSFGYVVNAVADYWRCAVGFVLAFGPVLRWLLSL